MTWLLSLILLPYAVILVAIACSALSEKHYQERMRRTGNPYYKDGTRLWGGRRWQRKHPFQERKP